MSQFPTVSPFKLLQAYDKDDTRIYFGRENETLQLSEALMRSKFLLLYGASGTGKTSLIQCGLPGMFSPRDWLPIFVRRGSDFVESLRAVGASNTRIIMRHIIPNGISPILVNASLALAGIVIAEATLSFLGVGVQEPTPSWGNMLSTAQSYMFQHPWLPLVPGIPLCLVTIAFNFIGDGLRDALDPRLKR